jgi:hypothetical protein
LYKHRPELKWHRKNRLYHRDQLDTLLEVSTATGEFAIGSSQPLRNSQAISLPPERRRKRGNPIQETSSDTDGRKKTRTQLQKAKADLDATLERISSAIEERQNSKNPVQRAIELLQQDYSVRLTSNELDQAIDVLTNKSKAIAFITLDKDIRDRWLRRNAGAEL